MEPFGKRVAAIRKELGLTQRDVAAAIDTDQPRITRIEKGLLPASVALIDKLATALHRTPADLVSGTDREGHYFAQGLAPEQLAEIQSKRRARHVVAALTLLAVYQRVVDMFAALHSGPYIIAPVSGEEQYLALRELCTRTATDLGDAPELYLPDHFEIVGEDDALEREFTDEELRTSLLQLRAYVHGLNVPADVRDAVQETHATFFNVVDENIEELRRIQTRENKQWIANLEQAKREGRFDGLFGDSKA